VFYLIDTEAICGDMDTTHLIIISEERFEAPLPFPYDTLEIGVSATRMAEP